MVNVVRRQTRLYRAIAKQFEFKRTELLLLPCAACLHMGFEPTLKRTAIGQGNIRLLFRQNKSCGKKGQLSNEFEPRWDHHQALDWPPPDVARNVPFIGFRFPLDMTTYPETRPLTNSKKRCYMLRNWG